MTLARAIRVCYSVAHGNTSYGLEMRTWNNKSFSASSTSVYTSSVIGPDATPPPPPGGCLNLFYELFRYFILLYYVTFER